MTEPRPIPEHSPTYDGHNAEEIMEWAHRTLEHYEQGHRYIGYQQPAPDKLTFQNPYLHPDHGTVTISTGQSLTFSERARAIVSSASVTNPEILVHDHVRTVAETAHLRQVQGTRGISIPQPGRNDFVERRASAAYDAPTLIPGSTLEASMARHPSGTALPHHHHGHRRSN